mmetsp:Transcript_18618/g.42556  ORF Transcript_18618/g.42556 Transcript_18618/m.42556 type:complete len:247 (-) Transcript_18618:904-1644(-)
MRRATGRVKTWGSWGLRHELCRTEARRWISPEDEERTIALISSASTGVSPSSSFSMTSSVTSADSEGGGGSSSQSSDNFSGFSTVLSSSVEFPSPTATQLEELGRFNDFLETGTTTKLSMLRSLRVSCFVPVSRVEERFFLLFEGEEARSSREASPLRMRWSVESLSISSERASCTLLKHISSGKWPTATVLLRFLRISMSLDGWEERSEIVPVSFFDRRCFPEGIAISMLSLPPLSRSRTGVDFS